MRRLIDVFQALMQSSWAWESHQFEPNCTIWLYFDQHVPHAIAVGLRGHSEFRNVGQRHLASRDARSIRISPIRLTFSRRLAFVWRSRYFRIVRSILVARPAVGRPARLLLIFGSYPSCPSLRRNNTPPCSMLPKPAVTPMQASMYRLWPRSTGPSKAAFEGPVER